MENIKEKSDLFNMNINNFSKILSKNLNIEADSFSAYIFANISVGLVRTEEMKRDINRLYEKDKFKYYNEAINSKCVNHVIITQGTLEQEINARKVLGILLIGEKDYNVRNAVIKLLRKYYPIVYKSIRNFNKKELKLKYLKMDSLTREIEARLDAAVYFYFSIYRSAEAVDQGFIISIINDIKNFELNNPINANIDKEIQIHKKDIQEIKDIIKREYGKLSSYKDIINIEEEYVEDISIMLENLFIINKLDINYLFQNYDFINIDKIILSHIKSGKISKDKKTIADLCVNGIFIQSLINEYKKVRNIYFNNSQETLFFKLNYLEEKNQELQEKYNETNLAASRLSKEKKSLDEMVNIQINKINKEHKNEFISLNNRIKELETQLSEEKKYRQELNRLREYIFQVDNEYTPNEYKETLNNYINDKKIIIVGGTKEWRRKFREKYPQIRTLNGFNDKFDVNALNNIDYIFFYTGYMSHSTYYKIMNYTRSNQTKFGYIGKTNMALVEYELVDELKRYARA